MDSLLQDLRFGIRTLIKSPLFALMAILTLALGIGANTAIFSIIDGVLLRPLPYPESNRLLVVWESWEHRASTPVAFPKFADWQNQNQVFDKMAIMGWGDSFTLTGAAEPEQIHGNTISGGYFPILGVSALHGRTFLAEDESGGEAVVILSHGLWKRRFNADQNIIGKRISLDAKPRTVVGVLPPDFKPLGLFGDPAELFVPLVPDEATARNRSSHGWVVLARLKHDVSLPQAQVQMDIIAQRLAQAYPETDKNWFVKLVPAHEQFVGDIRSTLLVLMGAVGFVLLIACANVANLLLARGTARRREIAIRTALGAGRLRVIRQVLAESVLLALAGGALGLLLATWVLGVVRSLAPVMIPQIVEIKLNGHVLGITLAACVFTGILFGIVPALTASRISTSASLQERGRGSSSGRSQGRARSVFVAVEIAFSLVLLVGAGLMIKSFLRLSGVKPGFDTVNVLAVGISPSPAKYPLGEVRARYFDQIIQGVRTIPGVQSVGGIQLLPLGGGNTAFSTHVVGRPPLAEGDNTPNYRVVTRDYFRAMGIAVPKGRDFTEIDRSGSPLVVIINETFARNVFPGEDPIGKQLIVQDDHVKDNRGEHREIVGVVKDAMQFTLSERPRPEVYVPYSQSTEPVSLVLVARTSLDARRLIPAIRKIVREIDKDQALSDFRTMEQVVDRSVAPQRFNMLLLSAFAAIAIALAAVGIYGVMAYTVTQRTHEIGIRMALGADKANVLKLVVRQGMTVTLLGLFLGVVASLGLTRLLEGLLFNIKPNDPATFVSVSLLLGFIAFLACLVPARRAARVDPMIALRHD